MHNYWKSKQLYEELFGKDVKLDSQQVKDLMKILRSLPDQQDYDIITYGSLMNFNDSNRTLPRQLDRFNCVLKNYERIFNVGWKEQGAFLYIKREGLYDIVPVHFHILNDYQEPDEEGIFKGFTVISSLDYYGIEPQLNYFHLCLTGVLQEMGDIGYNNFLDSTKCYSVKQHKYIMAREWLKELDLIDYMTRHTYSPR